MMSVEQAREYDRRMRARDRALREPRRDDVMRAVAPGGPQFPGTPSLARCRGGREWGSSMVRLDLLDTTKGTFTRASEGAYLTGAPNSGSSAFLAWAASNVRRAEDRGDGNGSTLLMEGARTNIVPNPRDTDAAGWTAGTAVDTPRAVAGPDGAVQATRTQADAGEIGNYRIVSQTIGLQYVRTAWGRVVTPPGAWQAFTSNPNLAAAYTGIDGTWRRIEINSNATTATGGFIPADARDWSASGGIVATAQDVYHDLHQVEQAYFPSSPIRGTGAGPFTRATDALSYAVGEYPASFLSTGFRVRFAPDATHSEIVSSALNQVLVGLNGETSFLVLINDAGTLRARMTRAGVTQVQTAITFSRGQFLTFTCEPSLGRLTVAGATTGNGTFTGTTGAWGSFPLLVGGFGGANRAFGRFGRYIEAI